MNINNTINLILEREGISPYAGDIPSLGHLNLRPATFTPETDIFTHLGYTVRKYDHDLRIEEEAFYEAFRSLYNPCTNPFNGYDNELHNAEFPIKFFLSAGEVMNLGIIIGNVYMITEAKTHSYTTDVQARNEYETRIIGYKSNTLRLLSLFIESDGNYLDLSDVFKSEGPTYVTFYAGATHYNNDTKEVIVTVPIRELRMNEPSPKYSGRRIPVTWDQEILVYRYLHEKGHQSLFNVQGYNPSDVQSDFDTNDLTLALLKTIDSASVFIDWKGYQGFSEKKQKEKIEELKRRGLF